jgi:hypothetical protein
MHHILGKSYLIVCITIFIGIVFSSGCLDIITIKNDTHPWIVLLYPNGNEYLGSRELTKITWHIDDETINSNSINIYYSIDGGYNWTRIASNESNDGIYYWDVPGIDSTSVRIKIDVKDLSGNSFSDESAANFTIDSKSPLIRNVRIYDIDLDSYNNVWDGDSVKITAEITDVGLNPGDTHCIIANLSDFGYGDSIPTDTYDGEIATWTINNVSHKPLRNSVKASVKIIAFDPINRSGTIFERINVYPLKIAIIEFAPKDVQYGELFCCYSNSIGYYLQSMKEYCNNIVEVHDYLEIFNNPNYQFYEGINFSNDIVPRSVYYIEKFFEIEAQRYGFQLSDSLNIDTLGPYSLKADPPNRNRSMSTQNLTRYFDNEVKNNSINISNYDIMIFVYFFDKYYSQREYNGFTSFANGGNTAYVCVDTSRITTDQNVQTVAHELAHIMGASDKYHGTEEYSCVCEIPDGLPEPDKEPVFPQQKACLMCGFIVADEDGYGFAPQSLDEVVICHKTAEEIGWAN